MRAWLLDVLACPVCPGEVALELSVERADGEDIVEGRLACASCQGSWAIHGGVPRFVTAGDDYCANFGLQWNTWRRLQIDRLAGHTLSRTRFLADSGWPAGWIADKLILDCGAGAGRFTDVAAGLGARVVAVDLSDAVDACRQNTLAWDGRVQPVQASLFNLPLRQSAFDGVFCMGVIQHTPEPERLMSTLPRWLKPGGRLAYNFYEADFWPKLQPLKYALRLVTPHLPGAWTLALSKAMTRLLFPLTRALAGVPKVRILNHVMPICASHSPHLTREQQYAWTLLDTFDWYGPRYEIRQKHRAVGALLERIGLTAVETAPGLARAQKP